MDAGRRTGMSLVGAQPVQVAAVVLLAGVVLRVAAAAFGTAAVAGAVVAGLLVAALALVWRRLPEGSVLRSAAWGAAVAAAAAATGLLLAGVGALAGPLAMLLLPAALAAGLTVLLRPVAAVAVVLLVLPFGLRELPGQPFGLQVMQVTALVAVGAAVVGRALVGARPVDVPAPLVWAVLLVPWGVLSTLSAVSLDHAVRQVVALAVNVALALVAATVVGSAPVLRRLLWLLLAVGSASCVPALLGAGDLRAAYGGGVVSGRLAGTFTQPNQFGSFTMVVALVGAGVLLSARTSRERLLAGAALVPVLLGLLLSLSRSSWIGLLGGLAVLCLLLPSARRALLAVGVPLVAAAVALGAFAPESPQVQVVGARVSTLAETGGGNPYDDRPRIWAEGRREVVLDPVTGQGPGNFPVVSTRTGSDATTVQAEHAHDVLLTVAAEYGLPGAALLVGLTVHLGLVVLAAVRRGPRRLHPLVVGPAAACCGIAVQGLVDYTMRNAVLFTLVWLVAGLTAAAAAVVARAGDEDVDEQGRGTVVPVPAPRSALAAR